MGLVGTDEKGREIALVFLCARHSHGQAPSESSPNSFVHEHYATLLEVDSEAKPLVAAS